MNLLVVTPDRNGHNPKHPADFVGAFLPESLAFVKHHKPANCKTVRIALDQPEGARRAQLLDAIAASPPIDVLACFTHGLRNRLPQLGWSLGDVVHLATALAASCANDLRVILYACDTAGGTGPGGDGGFADALRDDLVRLGVSGVQVDAHFGAGGCCKNPNVRRFNAEQHGKGGMWLVEPPRKEPPKTPAEKEAAVGRAKLWFRWAHALKGPLRFDFPFMSQAEIVAKLSG